MEDLSYSTGYNSTGNRVSTAFPTLQSSGRQRTRVLDFHSGRKCPTCGGTGKIPKGQDDQLVALIPYSDERLKPRRTWLCVIFVITSVLLAFVLLVGIVLAVFMFPRTVDITFNNCTQFNDSIGFKNPINLNYELTRENITNLTLDVETSFTVSNNNFFSIQLSQINVTYTYLQSSVSGYSSSSANSVSIGPRKTKDFFVSQSTTFEESDARRVFAICTVHEWSHVINIEIEVSLTYVYLTHASDSVTTFHKLLKCGISFPIKS